VQAQDITNLVFVSDDGVTEDFSKAKAFIIIKQYPDHFERLDYNKAGPMLKNRSYKDAELKILEGKYCEYLSDGSIVRSGNYLNNKKHGYWHTYDDYGKVIYTARYAADSIVEILDLYKDDAATKYAYEREADFPGGQKAWHRYVIKSLAKSNTAKNMTIEGVVNIAFKVDTTGALTDVVLVKSAEYALDNEAMQIILKSPKWNSAWQNGKAVNAYRIQPFNFEVSK
jgi:protein TonB